jgi:hypothetical protein
MKSTIAISLIFLYSALNSAAACISVVTIPFKDGTSVTDVRPSDNMNFLLDQEQSNQIKLIEVIDYNSKEKVKGVFKVNSSGWLHYTRGVGKNEKLPKKSSYELTLQNDGNKVQILITINNFEPAVRKRAKGLNAVESIDRIEKKSATSRGGCSGHVKFGSYKKD